MFKGWKLIFDNILLENGQNLSDWVVKHFSIGIEWRQGKEILPEV